MVGDREEGSSDALDANAILALCDRALGEPGRRRHLFSWLRAPGSDSGQWLVIDAYYPGNRLVVLCGEHPYEYEELWEELVPAHGLRLLYLDAAELGGDAEAAEASLRRLIAELALPARPTGELIEANVAPGPGTIARVAAAFAQAGTAPGAARGSPRGSPRASRAAVRTARRPGARAAAQPPQIEVAGVAAGFALAAIVCVEMYVGVGLLALDGGHWLLAFGLSMDACSRVLGAIAAGRCGSTEWTWWCVIAGSPAVAWFVLYEGEEPLSTEPAPLAAVLALLAGGAVVLALLGPVLGI